MWARIRVIGEESIEYSRRIGRIPLGHGEQVDVDLVRRDLFEDGGVRPGVAEVRLAGIRLGLAQAELVGAWIATALALAGPTSSRPKDAG